MFSSSLRTAVYAKTTSFDTNDKFEYRDSYYVDNLRYIVYQKPVDYTNLHNIIYYDASNNKVVTDESLIDKLKIISLVNMKTTDGKAYLLDNISNSFIGYCNNGSSIVFRYMTAMTLADQAGLFAGSVLTGMNYSNYFSALQKRWTSMDKDTRMQNLSAISETFMLAYISLSFTNSQNYFANVMNEYDKSSAEISDYETAYNIYTNFIRANDLFNSAFLFEYNYLYDKLPKDIWGSLEKVASKVVESGLEGAAAMLPDTVDIEILNDLGTYRDLYDYISGLIADKDSLDMILTLLTYIGIGDDIMSATGMKSIGDYNKIELSVLLTAALQSMKDSGKFDKEALKKLSANITSVAKLLSLLATTIGPLTSNLKYAIEANTRYSKNNFDLYGLNSTNDSNGNINFDGTELLLSHHSDWSGLYSNAKINVDWDWDNVSSKIVWMEVYYGGGLLGLTNDGILFALDEFDDEDISYLKLEGYNFYSNNRIIMSTNVKSVKLNNYGIYEIYKYDGSVEKLYKDSFIDDEILQVMDNLVLKENGTLYIANKYNSDILYNDNVSYKKILSNVKQIIY